MSRPLARFKMLFMFFVLSKEVKPTPVLIFEQRPSPFFFPDERLKNRERGG